ncbi:EamA family transporter, partial [Acinetobacter baumannii]
MSQGNLNKLLRGGGHLGAALMIIAGVFYAFYGVFLKKWQLSLPIMTSLYVQIGFYVLFHLTLIFWFGLDALNAQNAPSAIYAGGFASL